MVTRVVQEAPRTTEFEERRRQERADREFETAYRKWLAADTSRIRLLGIRTPEVVDFDLETAWVDLGVGALKRTALPGDLPDEIAAVTPLEAARKRWGRLRRETERAAESVAEVLKAHMRLVIVGTPGSGKTTLMRYLAHLAAKNKLHKVGLPASDTWLPLLFLVRNLNFAALPRPEEFVAHLAPNLQGQCPDGFVHRCLSGARATILVDGLDECERANHQKVINWITDLTNSFGDCRFIVTSRPAGYRPGELRVCGYAEAELQPLGKKQRRAFVHRWYRAAEKLSSQPDAEAAAKQGAEDLLQRIARTPSVQALATNPLLLAVLCVVHHYRHQTLPQRRTQLLDECVDVLLHEWRHAQLGARIGLMGEFDAKAKAALVQPLAWWMMQQGIAEARRADVEHIFKEVLPTLGQDPNRAGELLDHIRQQSGLLVEQRPDIFAFAHLVFQEYMAAEYAEDEGCWDALLAHASDDQWSEVIPLAAGLTTKAAQTFVRALIQKGHLALAGRCVATSITLPPELRCEVIEALVADARLGAVKALAEIGGTEVVRACLTSIAGSAFDSKALTEGYALALVAAYRSAFSVAKRRGGEWASRLEAVLPGNHAAEIAARSAAFSAAESAACSVGESAAFSAAVNAARSAARSAADECAWKETERVLKLCDLLDRLGLGDSLGEVCRALEDCTTPEPKVFLWWPIAEELEPTDCDWAVQQLGTLPGHVYPLLRLCVSHRLRHRWQGRLSEEQTQQLQELVNTAEADLRHHFERFNETVKEETKKALAEEEHGS